MSICEGQAIYWNCIQGCELILPKKYLKASLSKSDIVNLLSGKETRDIQFKWRSGKTGTAKLKYTNKLEFLFNNYKK